MDTTPSGHDASPAPAAGTRRELVMDYTDERMIPERSNDASFWEHIFRYQFAASMAAGKSVLDIACGEGYGSSALAMAGAVCVTGVDISGTACRHAREKYGVDARVGAAEKIPLEDRSVEMVVSFETMEHLSEPDLFLEECLRVLKRPGIAVLSTPNKTFYDPAGGSNQYHQSEMTEEQFAALLGGRFDRVEYFGQAAQAVSWRSWRTFSSENSPWWRIPGFSALRKLCCPPLRTSHTGQFRKFPEKAILKAGRYAIRGAFLCDHPILCADAWRDVPRRRSCCWRYVTCNECLRQHRAFHLHCRLQIVGAPAVVDCIDRESAAAFRIRNPRRRQRQRRWPSRHIARAISRR